MTSANLTGKFRGAEFLIEGHDLSGGRRIALHEFPLRDVPYAEDMGRRARTWAIECFTLGDDSAARDALIEALEGAGPGTLIHPYLGTLHAVVQDFRVAESTGAARIARFSITFAEAGERIVPAATADTASALDGAATAASAAAMDGFTDQFDVGGWASYVSDGALSDLSGFIAQAEGWARMVRMASSDASSLARRIGSFAARLGTLIGLPETLAGEIGGIIANLAGYASTPMGAVSGLASARDYQRRAVYVRGSTPARAQIVTNAMATEALVRRAAVIESARAVATMRFGVDGAPVSSVEAAALRDALADQIDLEAEVADDATSTALVALRAALVRHINTKAAALPGLAQVTPKATLPALVLAHRIHGDASRADEIIARNRVRHPGFVPGGVALEVLNG